MAKQQTYSARPEALAVELGVKAKQLRAFLRSEFPRTAEDKGTSWNLTPKQIEAVVEHYSSEEEE